MQTPRGSVLVPLENQASLVTTPSSRPTLPSPPASSIKGRGGRGEEWKKRKKERVRETKTQGYVEGRGWDGEGEDFGGLGRGGRNRGGRERGGREENRIRSWNCRKEEE